MFWQATVRLGLGSLILVLPFLWAVARTYPFYSLGPFGDAWWILLFTSLFGLLVVLGGLESLLRFFRAAWKAVRRGMAPATALEVASDRSRDMGFLLQGARAYQGLDPWMRHRVARLRVITAAFWLMGAVWVVPGFMLSVMLAARGWLGTEGVWLLTLGPLGACLLIAVVSQALEGTLLKGFGVRERRSPWKDESLMTSLTEWNERSAAVRRRQGLPPLKAGSGTGFVSGAVGVVVLALAVIPPTTGLAFTNAVGPILAMVALPTYSVTERRGAGVQILSRFRLTPNQGITPMDAGEALQALAFVGRTGEPTALERPPVRFYPDPFLSDSDWNLLGLQPHLWPSRLFPALSKGIPPDAEARLREVAAHPALAEFEILGTAQAMDLVGARWVTPFPEGATLLQLPLPRFSEIRSGGQALVARAALAWADGRPEEAEHTLRTLISAGFALGDEGVTLIDNLIGFVLADMGGDALEAYLRESGREDEARELSWAREAVEDALLRVRLGGGREDLQGALERMPGVVSAPDAVRGLRWEYLSILSGIGPCLNAHRVVYGPDADYRTFLSEARASLVRYPAEAAYFDLVQKGWFGALGAAQGVSWFGRVVSSTLGGTETPGSCAALLGQIPR